MNRYERYKQSGIEWIGEIPEHWVVKKLKYIGETIIGITYSPDDVSNEENGILVLRSSNIQDGKLAFDDCVFVNKEVKEKHLTREGDVLLCARNGSAHLVGKSALIKQEHSNLTFGAFMTIFRSSIGEFAYQFFNSQIFKSQTGLFATSTINQLTTDTLNNLFVPMPSPEEQVAITNYLDTKTAEIDKLIFNKRRLIELLKEERMTLINTAVSGEGKKWINKKLKYLVSLRDEMIEDADFKIAVENIESGSGKLINMHEEKTYQGQLFAFKKGDILFNKLRPYLHKVYFAERDGGVFGELLIIVSKEELLPAFLFYKLFSKEFIDIVDGSTQGTKMPRANWDDFISQQLIAFPESTDEQQEIVTNLQAEIGRIDNAVAKVQSEIELMQEYKTALISEVVTGKQKVI